MCDKTWSRNNGQLSGLYHISCSNMFNPPQSVVVSDLCLYPIGSMVLVYLTTKLGDLVRANVDKYSIHGAYGYSYVDFSMKKILTGFKYV